ncbi:MAG: peptidase M23 [uncultured bacterium (gcode 4)]|uniref:Peptidase M23 n=1 Tax=uncultured bacterium (gcode 4) TaxID=1234023 RepID=K2AWB7_9BACT|nr:MAG: peptidase M23 [uncultured bacterium (gcode 4)]
MRKIIISFFAFIAFYNFAEAGNFVYPFDKVSDPKCRFSAWNTLSENCKISIPRIEKWDYTKYKNNTNYRRIYSILWGSTYDYWWDVWYGSHLGVDIATSAGTPVRSIWDWEVIVANWLAWRWNSVTIKHKLNNWTYVYSNYSHLNKIFAKKWDIKAWETIWEVWSTWNSYWNHLHFQIDITNQSHPYWYSVCSKWVDIFDVVNDGMCRDFLTANTIDPILFLESNWEFKAIEDIKQMQDKTEKINKQNIKTREQILDEEIAEFLKIHSFKLNTWVSGNNLIVWKNYITKLNVLYFNRLFSWNLPGTWIAFEYDKTAVKVFPEKAIAVDNWFREITITWLKSGAQTINLKLGKQTVWSITINFYKWAELGNPTDASFIIKSNIALWDEKLAWIVFKTKFWSKQIYIPYDGTYKVKSLSGKVKFCNVSRKKVRKCNNSELVEELTFRYDDTLFWVLLFNVIPLDYSPIKLTLSKEWKKYDIARMKSQTTISNPNNLDKSYLYFNENISALKKWLLRLDSWYLLQDREIIWKQVKEIITNYLSYEFLRSWDNYTRKTQIISKINQIKTNFKTLDDYKKFNRAEFAKVIFDNLWLDLVKNNDKVFIDETWDHKDYITTLRVKYKFAWKDQFKDRYFQKDKNITIWEALYLVEKINSASNWSLVFTGR